MQNTKAQFKLFFVLIIFIFPLIIGSLLYHYREHFHFKTSNHGTLMNPAVNLTSWQSEGKWQIVFSPQNCCDANCERTMFLLHQLRLILGNDSRRAGLVLALEKTCPQADLHDFKKVELNQFSAMQKNKIYLVDPQNNLFMFYPGNVDLMNVYNDLKHVLQVSQIG